MIQILSISTIVVDGNLILYSSSCHCEERSDVAVSFSATHTLFLYLCILIYLFIRIFLLIFESVIANTAPAVCGNHILYHPHPHLILCICIPVFVIASRLWPTWQSHTHTPASFIFTLYQYLFPQ